MKINEAFCDKDNRPYQDIRITHTIILDDPLDDPAGIIFLVFHRAVSLLCRYLYIVMSYMREKFIVM